MKKKSKMSSYIFHSNRLGFRNYKEEDKPLFQALNKDEEVMKYFPSTLTEEASNALLLRLSEGIQDNGYGFFAVEIIDTGEFIGFIGLQKVTFESKFTPCIEIGWRLRKEFWNKGYATEGANACLNYGFNHLKFKEIHSFCPEINLPSERIMLKIGMLRQEAFLHPKILEYPRISKCVRYKILANQFQPYE